MDETGAMIEADNLRSRLSMAEAELELELALHKEEDYNAQLKNEVRLLLRAYKKSMEIHNSKGHTKKYSDWYNAWALRFSRVEAMIKGE